MEVVDDLVLRRQVRLGRYSNTLEAQYRKDIRRIDDNYLVRIRRVLDAMTDRDKLAYQKNGKTKRATQLRDLMKKWTAEYKLVLKAPMSEGYDDIYRVEKAAMPGKPTHKEDKKPKLIMGKTVANIVATSANKFISYVDSRVKQMMADNQDPYLGIDGTPALNRKDGAVHLRDTSAVAHIANAIFGGASAGRLHAYKERDVERVVWLATLDDRTCVICGSRDGKKYREDIAPEQPAHTNCRCTYIPDMDTDARRGALVGEDVNKATTVPGNTTYEQWFGRQSEGFQREVLGKGRYDLYKSGDYPLKKFVDPRTGRKYTLDDLETLN